MTIKKDDLVVVITGKDKGKKGKVLKVYPKTNRVVVEGVNMLTKHAKAKGSMPAEIKHVEGTIDASNVMLWDSKANAATRVSYKVEAGKKQRVSKKSGAVID